MRLCVDYRLGGTPRYFMGNPDERLMLISDEIRKSVCFLCIKSPNGPRLAGTAFFVFQRFEQIDLGSHYLVTAKHIIWGARNKYKVDTIYARINTKDGRVTYLPLTLSEEAWSSHPDDPYVDVALFKHPIDVKSFDCLAIPSGILLTEETLKSQGIGLGDEVITVGLFHKHYGRARNTPIVRVGNIASLPEEPVRTKMFDDHVDIEAYLIEARSISGLSGSPVFAHLGQVRVIDGEIKRAPDPVMFVLGLIHGHWDEDVATEDVIFVARPNVDRINTGIAIVTPASKLIDALAHPELVDARRQAEKNDLARDLPTLDMSETILEREKNPHHKEEFNRLLRKFVRGKKLNA